VHEKLLYRSKKRSWTAAATTTTTIIIIMATATSAATPTVVRSSSARVPAGNTDLPSRHRSSVQRPTSSSHRSSSSRSHTHDPPPISNQAALANVSRRDHETVNVTRPPSSKRSSSRDRASDGGQQYHPEPARSHHRDRSRPGSTRNSADMSRVTTVVSTGGSTQVPASSAVSDRPISSAHPAMGRRRTSISTSTGIWSLGKTIGQGSMGKVKLAKNTETGEQVCQTHQRCVSHTYKCRSPSK
jgi:serine/threonine protein kinase KIN1/2